MAGASSRLNVISSTAPTKHIFFQLSRTPGVLQTQDTAKAAVRCHQSLGVSDKSFTWCIFTVLEKKKLKQPCTEHTDYPEDSSVCSGGLCPFVQPCSPHLLLQGSRAHHPHTGSTSLPVLTSFVAKRCRFTTFLKSKSRSKAEKSNTWLLLAPGCPPH